MTSLERNLVLSLVLVILLYSVGFLVYNHFEGWNLMDSIYFQTTTSLTIGYGDITPKTDAGKLFTVLISWISISIAFFVLYTISTYRERILDRRINEAIFDSPSLKKASYLKPKHKKNLFL